MTYMPVIDVAGPVFPSVPAVEAAGYGGVISYISSPGGRAKDWTREAWDYYDRWGLARGVVFEDSAKDSADGYGAGVRLGDVALSQCQEVGIDPHNGCVYAAHDWDIPEAAMVDAVQFQQGWNTAFRGLARGAYGGLRIIDRLFDLHLIDFGWQTRAWSGGIWDARAQLRQTRGLIVDGVSADHNDVLAANWGQWTGAEMSQAEVEAGVRKVLGLDESANMRRIAPDQDNSDALWQINRSYARTAVRFDDVMTALTSIRQALGPMADRDAAILAAIAALDTPLTDEDAAKLADALHLDAAAVAVAVQHRIGAALSGTS